MAMIRSTDSRPFSSRPRMPRHRCGFTIIETIATMTILSAIGSVASIIIYTTMDSYTDGAVTAQLHAELSITMDRAIRELRKIPRDDADTIATPDINSVTATSITWNTDYTLALSGANLMYTENGGTAAILQSNVTTFNVQACDESNTALGATLSGAGCGPIRRLQLTITAQRHGVSDSLRAKMFIRETMTGAAYGP